MLYERPIAVQTRYYINLNYVCNERCVFCAANLAKGVDSEGYGPSLSFEQIRRWVGTEPPGAGDRVLLAGGEPTLHKELLPIVRFLHAHCADVTIFTNGLRLAQAPFARALVESGVTRFEIALFGATPDRHDAITRVPGSFKRTLSGLRTLAELRQQFEFVIELRLLVSRQSSAENPMIVRLIQEQVPGIDAFSLNRLILSDDAKEVTATVSWADARESINETARLVRKFGYELIFGAIPLCVFEKDNAEFIREQLGLQPGYATSGPAPETWRQLYLDPVTVSESIDRLPVASSPALPACCLFCDYVSICKRVEPWYLQQYGNEGLQPVVLSKAQQALTPKSQ